MIVRRVVYSSIKTFQLPGNSQGMLYQEWAAIRTVLCLPDEEQKVKTVRPTNFETLLLDKFESCNVSTANLQSPSAPFFLSLMKRMMHCNHKLVSAKPCPLVTHNAQTIAPFTLAL